ncbi:helix-turn-helix domain-containing protein [Andreprevotia chitinilytica]|uniref:helix-turn-helix domain-containing protein n=1 Tax=Andreprevotia chitinilytica TaxID=396808 RepID=UPI0005513E91|nr:helix-turn-helix transcriptional regulator [Andreprevotia chitinilytica]
MSSQRKELGDFLMALRQKCEPAAFGFPAGLRRRTQGLRREEVAQLAAISPTWYAWIEQGRDISVSSDVLDRLADSLRMDKTQRAYLFELAGRHDARPARPEHDMPPETLQQLVDGFAYPAYVLGRYWDVLASNPPAQALFGNWLNAGADAEDASDTTPPNLLRFVFLDPAARTLVEDWETRARRLAAEFRADCRTDLDDTNLQQLVDTLAQASPEFARYWKLHDVLERQGGLRGFNHPTRGRLTYQQVTFRLVDQEHLKLVLLTPESA